MYTHIPQNPLILLSFVNTYLRDFCNNLDQLQDKLDCDILDIKEKLQSIGYIYSDKVNQFVSENSLQNNFK